MSAPRTIRIGTRGSRLAMWQAEWVRALLAEERPDLVFEIVVVRTLGDRNRTDPLSGLARQGVFTKELEEALRDGRSDLAVHSMKDLPVRLPGGLRVGAVLKRGDPRDALVSRGGETLAGLRSGSVVGTSSLRRRSQILHLRPDLVVRDLRGNVPRRLRAVGIAAGEEEPERDAGRFDATVLAGAGLDRLGLDRFIHERFDPERFVPAPAQGAVAVEILAGAEEATSLLRPIHDPATASAVSAEREFLDALGGWCHVPVGAYAAATAGAIRLIGLVADPDGRRVLRGDASGSDPLEVGRRLADDLAWRGAREIIEKVVRETAGGEERP